MRELLVDTLARLLKRRGDTPRDNGHEPELTVRQKRIIPGENGRHGCHPTMRAATFAGIIPTRLSTASGELTEEPLTMRCQQDRRAAWTPGNRFGDSVGGKT
jgi:hypothetical protein